MGARSSLYQILNSLYISSADVSPVRVMHLEKLCSFPSAMYLLPVTMRVPQGTGASKTGTHNVEPWTLSNSSNKLGPYSSRWSALEQNNTNLNFFPFSLIWEKMVRTKKITLMQKTNLFFYLLFLSYE